MRRFTEILTHRGRRPQLTSVKGLTLIHLFNKVWRIGGFKIVDDKFHSVIYSPEDKEYHVWGDDVISFYPNYEVGEYGRSYTKPDPAKVKIYILTTIMDDRSKWCFDLKVKPETGKQVKVIYNNGTIKNIEFSGEWEPTTINRKYWEGCKIEHEINPVCFRM